jgi:hypothetical protein
MSELTLQTLLGEAMVGVEEARLGLMKAAKAIDEAGINFKLHGDLLIAMDEMRDLAARLTEHVDYEESDESHE